MKRIGSFRWLGVGAAVLLPVLAVAQLSIPNTFMQGDPVSASQMNANFDAIKAKVDELEARLEEHEATEGWIEPVFLNGWENYGGSFTDAGYRKDAHGIVHLRGLVRNGTLNTDIFQLPEGYRPASDRGFAVVNGTAGVTQLWLGDAGLVTTQGADSTIVSLDGVSFPAGL